MFVTLTMREALDRCKNWEDFCEDQGYSIFCIKEGGSDVDIILTEEEAKKHGII